MIVEVGDEFPVEVPKTYIWMTLHQMKTFIKYNNYLNIAARSLIAAIRFVRGRVRIFATEGHGKTRKWVGFESLAVFREMGYPAVVLAR